MKKRILLLAANPAGTTALRLDEEARAIQEELHRANQRDQFEFVTRLAARPMDLLRSLRDVKPTIVQWPHRDSGAPQHWVRRFADGCGSFPPGYGPRIPAS
jgi:hypothetical protein